MNILRLYMIILGGGTYKTRSNKINKRHLGIVSKLMTHKKHDITKSINDIWGLYKFLLNQIMKQNMQYQKQ